MNAYLTLDGTQSPAMTNAEGELLDVPFSNLAADRFLKGTLHGQFKVEGRGDGFQDVAANLDGRVTTWSENADLLQLAAEGAALDVGELIILLNERAGSEKFTRGRCTVIAFAFEDGIGTADPAVIDTDDSLVLINGRVNLKRETLELSVRSEAKDVSFGTLLGDITVGGTFRNPEISAISAETVLQFGIVAALGSISGGLAALPFVEIGDAPDAPCVDLLARAQSVQE